ncbi:MAG: sulfate ABC transporter substrate-binding protein [Burkholderiaceae bacterium]|jgi:sulfate transport system substrate-binding protein
MLRPKLPWLNLAAIAAVAVAGALIFAGNFERRPPEHLLNVSYDPTRELYRALNAQFVRDREKASGEHLEIQQSHGGSTRQAHLAINGELQPDVVTLGLPSDVDALRKRGQIAGDWAARLPNQSRPYYSTIVFVVRQGNPHAIADWPDLIKPGVEVITPDPKSSGNGKLSALAAWGSVVTRGGSEAGALDYLRELYLHTPFLVPAAREAGLAFAVERLGDVHLAWENEALREVDESKGSLRIVYPPVSILAEPSVAWVDANVKAHGTSELARNYLEYLFSDEAQEIIAQEGYRPLSPDALKRHADRLPPLHLFEVGAIARDWEDAENRFFAQDGIIDAVYRPKPR